MRLHLLRERSLSRRNKGQSEVVGQSQDEEELVVNDLIILIETAYQLMPYIIEFLELLPKFLEFYFSFNLLLALLF